MNLEIKQQVSEASLLCDQWYVYVYLDPRPGREGQHIYVGMGQTKHAGEASRMHWHWKLCERHRNRLFGRVLAKIKHLGLAPQMDVVAIFADAETAKCEERRLIALYGKRVERAGTLCNVTSGGDGSFGLPPEFRQKAIEGVRQYYATHPDESRARAEKNRLAWTPEKRATHAVRTAERLATVEARAKIRSGLLANADFICGASERMQALIRDPVFLARRTAAKIEACKTPAFRAKMSVVGKAFWNSPEGQALKSEMMTKAWENPEYRVKMTAERTARWKNEKFIAKAKAGMKVGIAAMSPEAKAAVASKRSEAAKKRWENPEFRARTTQAVTVGRRRQLGKPVWERPGYIEYRLTSAGYVPLTTEYQHV